MVRSLRALLITSLVFTAVGCPRGDDHLHPHPHPDDAAEDEGPTRVVTLFTDRHELFVEFPVPVVGEPVEFLAHFTILASGEPVERGALEVVARGRGGREIRETVDAPRRAGLYVPTVTFADAGPVELAFHLGAPHDESFDLGTVLVHPDLAAAEAATPAAEDVVDEVSFLLEQQWRIGLLLHEVVRVDLTDRIRVPGRVVPQHGKAAFVTPPVAGAIAAPPNGLPELGDRVDAGQLLGYLRPPLPVTEAAALAANRAQLTSLRQTLILERTTLVVRQAELRATRDSLDTRLGFVERTARRTRGLHTKGLATEQQADDAERELAATRADLEGTRALLTEIEAALARLDTLTGEVADGSREDAASGALLPLHAPISGVLVQAECIEGQFFEPTDVVFEIIDTAITWVEARVPEFDLPALTDDPSALLRIPGHSDTLIDLRHLEGASLAHFSPVVDTATHAARLLFEVPNGDGLLRIGQSIDVLLESRRARDALAVPREAIVFESGETMAYVLVGGETFQTRYVELGVEDGDLVEVTSGLAEGERVVSRGAHIVRLTSLAPEGAAAEHHH